MAEPWQMRPWFKNLSDNKIYQHALLTPPHPTSYLCGTLLTLASVIFDLKDG